MNARPMVRKESERPILAERHAKRPLIDGRFATGGEQARRDPEEI